MAAKIAKNPSGKDKCRNSKHRERSASPVSPRISSKKKASSIVEDRPPLRAASDPTFEISLRDEFQRRKSRKKKSSPRNHKTNTNPVTDEPKKNVLFDLFYELDSNENSSYSEVKKARSSGSSKTPPRPSLIPRNLVSWPDMPGLEAEISFSASNYNSSTASTSTSSSTSSVVGYGNINSFTGSIGSTNGNHNNNNNTVNHNYFVNNENICSDSKKKRNSGGSKSPPRQTNSKCFGKLKSKERYPGTSNTPSPSPSPTSASEDADPPSSWTPPPTLAWLGLVNPLRFESNCRKPPEKKSRTLPDSRKLKERSPPPKSPRLPSRCRGLDLGGGHVPRKVPAKGHHRSLSECKSTRLDNNVIRVKCVWEDDKRFVWVPRSVTVEELLLAIEDKYELPVESGQIKFRDPLDPNDLMTITTQDDLDMLFESDRVEVFVTRLSPPTSPAACSPHVGPISESRGHVRRYSEDLSKRNKVVRSSPGVSLHISENTFDKRQSWSSTPVTRESSPDPSNKWIIKHSDLFMPPDAKPLGCGYFGEVRLGYWRRRRVACKKIFEQNFRDKTDMEIFYREVIILSELRHPNVVLFLGACTDGKDKIIVTEYCEGGNLTTYLKNNPILDDATKIRIAKDVALGMNHLHLENVLHRDLTSSNILLSASHEAKVSDFGLSRRQFDTNTSLSCTMGSVAWMAPEVIENAKNFTKKSDVYSYGVILWELSTGQDPCPPDMSCIMLATKVLHEQYRPTITPGQIPEKWATLVKTCWAQNPDDRLVFDGILAFLETLDPNSQDVPSINVEQPSPKPSTKRK